MIYALTQHSKWNCLYHPFIWCRCGRGILKEGIDYNCERLTDEEYNTLQRNSRKQFKKKLKELLKRNPTEK